MWVGWGGVESVRVGCLVCRIDQLNSSGQEVTVQSEGLLYNKATLD